MQTFSGDILIAVCFVLTFDATKVPQDVQLHTHYNQTYG